MKKRAGWSVIILLVVLFTMSPLQALAEETDRNAVRAKLAEGGWSVVYGDLINEGDYAEFGLAVAGAVATENPAPIYAYFDTQLQAQLDKIQRTAPDIGRQALTNLLLRAFKSKGEVLRQGRLEISAGIATYRRWENVIYDEPRTYKCKQDLPFGGWTWSVCSTVERVERQVPWPNNHQPYFRFRWASATGAAAPSTTSTDTGKKYGLLCLSNLTDLELNYSYRWGDGQWQSSKVAAKGTRTHWWNYANGSQTSPSFTIRFDSDLTNGTSYKQYGLKRNATNDTGCQSGNVYEFKKVGSQALALYDSGR